MTTENRTNTQDRLLDHDYDGIQEYDNRLPNWWLYTLYGTIVFAIGYWFVFHTMKIVPLPEGRYELEMVAAAEAQLKRMEGQELTNETFTLMAGIPAKVTNGRQIYEQFCVVCHGTQGEGSVGPNLTDAYWLHGSRPLQIYDTVMHGVPEKGMAAWAGQLGPVRVQEVVSYVLTIKNTNVPGKAPQGDLVGPEDEAPAESPPAEPSDAPAGEPPADPTGDMGEATPGQVGRGGAGDDPSGAGE